MQTYIQKDLERESAMLLRAALNHGYDRKAFIIEHLNGMRGFKITRKKDELWFIVENYNGQGIISTSPTTSGEGFYDFEFKTCGDALNQFKIWIQRVYEIERKEKMDKV